MFSFAGEKVYLLHNEGGRGGGGDVIEGSEGIRGERLEREK